MRRLLVSVVVVAGFALPSGALAAGEFEPNDSFNSAFGPIQAGLPYSATFETENDLDLFYFYLPNLTQLQYQLVVPATNQVYASVGILQAKLQGSPELLSSVSTDPGETNTGAVTLQRGKYFARVCSGYDCSDATTNDGFSLTLAPAGVTSTYEPFAAACAAAQPPVQETSAAVAAAQAKLAKAQAKLKKAKARGHRDQIAKYRAKVAKRKVKVKAKEAEFEAATDAANAACSVPQ